MTHPRAFIEEYVEPAIALFYKNISTTHLAAHAIAQVDVLAEVTAIWTTNQGAALAPPAAVPAFRRDLYARHPILAIISDAHDSHKHGRLRNQTRPISQGQRPETGTKFGYVLGRYALGRSPTPYAIVKLRLNDGIELEVTKLLSEAMEAWETELQRLGL